MSIMVDRSRVLEISKHFYLDGGLNQQEAIELIQEYCLEFNKKSEDVAVLLSMSFQTGLIKGMIEDALEYYGKKFNIVKVFSAPDSKQNIFNNIKLLLIF